MYNPPRENQFLEDRLHDLHKELKLNISFDKPYWSNNLSTLERTELRELKSNEIVRVLVTDKNLTPALMTTDWVKTETLNHLSNGNSYSVVTREQWELAHDKVIKTRDKLMLTFKQFITPSVDKFFRSYDHFTNPAKFLIIPKTHKIPMVGRPIAASHSFIARPISVFVDELVKPIIKMPTVLRDSRELIQILESTELPTHCFLVTADVVSLYPNVDVKKALVALDLLSREVKAPDHETLLLIQLSRLVFENNFLYSKFSTDIVHQDFGLAMGTPFAVTAANDFMYHLEKDIVAWYSKHLVLNKWFIDDIFAIWSGSKQELLEFLDALNSKQDRIKITYIINESSIAFLDLFLYKNPTFSTLQFSTFQKPLNKYLYVPFEFFHPVSKKRAFIRGELMHYTRNSSTAEVFYDMREKFWRRLRVRGYPVRFLLPLFMEIKYSNRRKWLTS